MNEDPAPEEGLRGGARINPLAEHGGPTYGWQVGMRLDPGVQVGHGHTVGLDQQLQLLVTLHRIEASVMRLPRIK